MKNEENNEEKIVNYDLSALSLKELITLHDNVNEFLEFLANAKIDTEVKEGAKNG